jgi:hypothetical protein
MTCLRPHNRLKLNIELALICSAHYIAVLDDNELMYR